MVNKIAKALIAQRIARYATVESLEISSSFDRVELVVLLNGDHSPIKITLNGIVFTGDSFYPKQIRADRAWLHNLLVDNPKLLIFKIPKELESIIKKEKK